MIAPGPRDIVIKKHKPSGFFGTNLASYLTLLGCDSVIVVGTTTSGCVRATVVDAFSLNYRVILAEEGCFTAARPATPSACVICTPNMPTSSQRSKSFPTSISCLPICSICQPAVAAPQRRSGRRPNRASSGFHRPPGTHRSKDASLRSRVTIAGAACPEPLYNPSSVTPVYEARDDYRQRAGSRGCGNNPW